MASTRRLAAILAADVVGYSRLMGADEEGTLAALQALRRELADPKIKEHHGRIVKTTGDGLLAEFGSVVDAVRCAVHVQREMALRNAATSAERRIELRIGINLGDIIKDRGDIYGDGVNVAARLEALAEPGGICVSRVVRDQVRDKLDVTFEDRGEQQVKNIVRPVRVFDVRFPGEPATLAPGMPASNAPLATVIQSSIVAPRLSIVVLPFTNLSNDPDQQYFADAITEDLTTDLSRLADMLVISRNSAFTYKDKRVNTKQIGRELGVRYVLEGSVQRSGNRVRVTAQLIDAEIDVHLWADRFERDIGDLFVLQDEVIGCLANALNLALVSAEAARPAANPDALDYIFRGRANLDKAPTREIYAEAIDLFERALALDPRSVEAKTRLAFALVERGLNEMTESTAGDIMRAKGLIEEAVAASPRSWLAHVTKGFLLRWQGRPEEAILEFEASVTLNHNSLYSLFHLGWCKLMTGSIDEVIPLAEQCIRLNPRGPHIANMYWRIGSVHLLRSQAADAVHWFERARGANPKLPAPHALLASAYALRGEAERAATELAEARRLSGDDRYSSLARLQAAGYSGSYNYWGVPKVRALFESTYFAGLRKAGMPEE